mgnify:CR=1 FL=1
MPSDITSFPITTALLFSENNTWTGTNTYNQNVTLGTGAILHLPSGGVINFDAGDVTITHSVNALTFAGGTMNFGSVVATDLDVNGPFSADDITIDDATIGGDVTVAGTFAANGGFTSTSGSFQVDGAGAVTAGVVIAGTYNGVTIDNNAWTTYSPTVSSLSGGFTSASATGRYKQLGKTVFVIIDITITTNGGGGGYVTSTLPVSAFGRVVLPGHAYTIRKMLQTFELSATSIAIVFYDANYPGSDGEILVVTGVYEAA